MRSYDIFFINCIIVEKSWWSVETSVRVEIFLNYFAVENLIEFYISLDFSAHFIHHFIGGNICVPGSHSDCRVIWPSSTLNESSLLAVSIFQLWTFIKAGMPGTDLLQRKASKRTRLVKTQCLNCMFIIKSFDVWYFHLQCSKVHGCSFVYKVFFYIEFVSSFRHLR